MYGETSFELVEEIVKQTKLKETDVFLDLGSGKRETLKRIVLSCQDGVELILFAHSHQGWVRWCFKWRLLSGARVMASRRPRFPTSMHRYAFLCGCGCGLVMRRCSGESVVL